MSSTDALKAKEKGNAAFKAGQLPDAIGHYTTAILADRNDPTYPLNRAAAYLKLGKHGDADRDCTTVLHLAPKNVKALFRRAQARIELHNWDGAREDLHFALKLEPQNDAVKAELQRLDDVSTKRTLRPGRQSATKQEPMDSVKPNASTASTASAKRRRIPIEIVESPKSTPSVSLEPPELSQKDGITLPISSQSISSQSSSIKSDRSPPTVRIESTPTTQGTPQAPRPGVAGGIFRPSGKHTVVQSSPAPTGNRAASPTNNIPVKRPASPPVRPATRPSPSNVANVRRSAMKTKASMSLFTFNKEWGSLSTTSEKWDFISQILASSLPDLFQMSLESDLLASILETFSAVLREGYDHEAKDKIREYVSWLTEVPRFNVVLLFMNSQQKELAKSVCVAVDAAGIWKL